MSAWDYIPDIDLWDETDEYDRPRFRRSFLARDPELVKRYDIVCNRCGKGGLHWEEVDEGFRLYDNRNEKHVCTSAKSATAAEFEDLT